MDGKTFYNGKVTTRYIPFMLKGGKGDYFCEDGEIETCSGFIPLTEKENLLFGDDIYNDENSENDDPNKGDENNESYDNGIKDKIDIRLPPVPEVRFNLLRSVLPTWNVHPDMLPSRIMEAGEKTSSGWGEKALEALSEFEVIARKENLMVYPFFIICAWRLIGGKHIMPTLPMLMIPNSEVPLIGGSLNYDLEEMEMRLTATVCKIQWCSAIPESIREFSDEITHLDIMVSKPLDIYDRRLNPYSVKRGSSTNFTLSQDPYTGRLEEKRITDEVFPQSWRPRSQNDYSILSSLLKLDTFYTISEIPISEITQSDGFRDLDFNRGSLQDIYALEGYTPDYIHHKGVKAEYGTRISGRDTIWNLSLIKPDYAPIEKFSPYFGEETIKPRWVFYPDTDTDYYYLKSESIANSKIFRLPLRRHPSLNGAYWWGGLSDQLKELPIVAEEPKNEKVKEYPARIWRSSKENPLLYPDRLMMQLDVKKLIALCRAFRSSGLVATTVPTAYAFTTEGVFLLKETDDGIFKDAGLLTTHVLKDPSNLFIKGRGIEFITDRGLKIGIEGTSVKVISAVEDIDSSSAGNSRSGSAERILLYGNDEEGELMTRPLKLGDPEGFKRIGRIKVRGRLDLSKLNIEILGSRNLCDWFSLATTRGSIAALSSGTLVRFLKIKVKATLEKEEYIEGLAVEIIK